MMNHASLRENPVCPFGDLTWEKYYWVYPQEVSLHNQDYWATSRDPDGVERNLVDEWEQQVKKVKHIINFISKIPPGKILDVGCGPGFLLSAIDQKWNKYGVDVSRPALEYCSKYAKVYYGELPALKFEEDMFDVVVMNHVIEHISEPLKYMVEIQRTLKKGGYLIVETPDFDSGCARRFGKNYRMLHDRAHISLFTSFSLVKMLEDYEFEIMHVDYPFFDTIWFSRENMERMFDASKVSPPFYGNHIGVYCYNRKSKIEA